MEKCHYIYCVNLTKVSVTLFFHFCRGTTASLVLIWGVDRGAPCRSASAHRTSWNMNPITSLGPDQRLLRWLDKIVKVLLCILLSLSLFLLCSYRPYCCHGLNYLLTSLLLYIFNSFFSSSVCLFEVLACRQSTCVNLMQQNVLAVFRTTEYFLTLFENINMKHVLKV